jgi:hypothetical protein
LISILRSFRLVFHSETGLNIFWVRAWIMRGWNSLWSIHTNMDSFRFYSVALVSLQTWIV